MGYAGNYQSDYFDWMLSYNRTESMDASSREWLGSGNPDTLISDISIPVGHGGVSAGWRAELSAAATHVKKAIPIRLAMPYIPFHCLISL